MKNKLSNFFAKTSLFKYFLVFLSIVLFCFVIWMLIPEKEKKVPVFQFGELNNLEISEKVLVWLETQKNKKGFYNFGIRCDSDGQCQEPDEDSASGLGVLWAYFRHYQKTGDSNDIQKINYLLDLYSDKEKSDGVQNVFWNCKLMYEMWGSDLFSDAQKTKIKEICYRGLYYPPIVNRINEKIDSQEAAEIDINKAILEKEGLVSRFEKKVSEHEEGGHLIRYSAYSSDSVAKYLWDNRDIDLKMAKAYFSEAADLLAKIPNNYYVDGKCVLGISSLDLYSATRDQKYLDFAESLLKIEKIKQVCLRQGEYVRTNYCDYSLFEKSSCAIFADDLYKTTQKQEYFYLRNDIIKSLVNNNFDYSDYPGVIKGWGAFYTKEALRNKQNPYYFIKENGIISGILSSI